MTGYTMEEMTWSCEKKMEEGDGLRTLECLRGRLLAERQASRTAKENAELLGTKLAELENKLKQETKMRKKAEKRLKFLMKKLESFNISSPLEASEQSSSFENSWVSSSSSVSTSGSKDSDEYQSKSQSINSVDSQDQIKDIVTGNNVSEDSNHPSEESSRNQDVSHSSSDKANSSFQSSTDLKAEDHSSSSVKACVFKMETNEKNESDNEDYKVDNSMALVAVNVGAEPTKRSSELKIVNKSVSEVLDALRHAREKIQTSMERRRHIIRVGPV